MAEDEVVRMYFRKLQVVMENRRSRQGVVHGVAKNQTQLSDRTATALQLSLLTVNPQLSLV